MNNELETARANLAAAITAARGDQHPHDFATDGQCSLDTVYRWERGETVPRSMSNIHFLVKRGVPRSLIEAARPAKATRTVAA